MNTNHLEKFLSIAEFAELSGDSESTVRRAIKAGELPFQQRGPRKKIKIPTEALTLLTEQDARSEDSVTKNRHREKSVRQPNWKKKLKQTQSTNNTKGRNA